MSTLSFNTKYYKYKKYSKIIKSHHYGNIKAIEIKGNNNNLYLIITPF